MKTELRMNVADLLRHPGMTRTVRVEVPVPDLGTSVAWIDEASPVALDLRLESASGGVVASGRVRGMWSATCSRCLTPLRQDFDLRLQEVFEDDPVEDETYPIRNDEIDLEQPLRDLVVPDLPQVPLCQPQCRGLCPFCGTNLNEAACACADAPADPRWDALRDLNL